MCWQRKVAWRCAITQRDEMPEIPLRMALWGHDRQGRPVGSSSGSVLMETFNGFFKTDSLRTSILFGGASERGLRM